MARRSRKTNLNNLGSRQPLKQSTGDRIFDILREAILSHELPSGTPLIEAQLVEEFGVSKTPIREALQRLVYVGLADMEIARGVTVHTLTQNEIRDIFELRLVLEPLALQQSAGQLDAHDLDQLDIILDEALRAIDVKNHQELSQLNKNFHEQLVHKAHNQLLLDTLNRLSDRRRLLSLVGWRRENRTRAEWDEHRSVVVALREGNVDLAVERLTAHIQRFSKIVLDVKILEE